MCTFFIDGCNEPKYNMLTGKVANKHEIGCYFSPLSALREFLKSDQPYALILADDVTLPYDVALDRDWDYGFRTACIVPFPVKLEVDVPGQIPKARRIWFYRATTFHLFHLLTRFAPETSC